MNQANLDLEFHPVTSDRWQDLEALFGKNGAYGGCWGMWWRVTRSQFGKQAGGGNKEALKTLASSRHSRKWASLRSQEGQRSDQS